MLAIGVTTAPRKRIYLNDTVQQLKYEFPDAEIFIFAEPGTPKTVEANWIFNQETLGVGHNWLNGFRRLLYASYTPWIMMCEDDISLSANFGIYIKQMLRIFIGNSAGFISPYCSYVNANPKHPGWSLAKISAFGWCGMLCTIWPREFGYQFLSRPCHFKTETLPDGRIKKYGPDACIALHTLSLGKKIYIHTPSLVTHVGEESTHTNVTDTMQRQAYDGYYHPTFYRNN